jgi:hypothetical protein
MNNHIPPHLQAISPHKLYVYIIKDRKKSCGAVKSLNGIAQTKFR